MFIPETTFTEFPLDVPDDYRWYNHRVYTISTILFRRKHPACKQ